MRKIISVIVFVAALVWTWNLIHTSPTVGFETHSGIQEKLITLITETVKEKRAQATDFAITRLWTETMADNKVRATFAYRFSEPAANGAEMTDQTIEGEAILHREPSADQAIDRWVIQSVRTKTDAVNFQEGLVVGPVSGEDEIDPTAPAGTGAPTAPATEN